MMHMKLDYLFNLSFIYFIVFHISILFVYLIAHLDRMLTRLAYSMSRVVIKPAFCICENKDADQISAFVFATRIARSLYFLNPKFQASSLIQ